MSRASKALADKAFEAAALSKGPELTISGLADKYGISREAVSAARFILDHGLPEEIEITRSAKRGLAPIAAQIKGRMTSDKLKEIQYLNKKVSPQYMEVMQDSAKLWAKLGPALSNLTELPSPAEVVSAMKGNGRRAHTVNQHLERALNWLKEFEYEWRFFQLSKSTENTSDTGTGSATAGPQQPEPSTE